VKKPIVDIETHERWGKDIKDIIWRMHILSGQIIDGCKVETIPGLDGARVYLDKIRAALQKEQHRDYPGSDNSIYYGKLVTCENLDDAEYCLCPKCKEPINEVGYGCIPLCYNSSEYEEWICYNCDASVSFGFESDTDTPDREMLHNEIGSIYFCEECLITFCNCGNPLRLRRLAQRWKTTK